MTLIEVLAVWGITLNERQAQQLLEEMMGADDFVVKWRVKGEWQGDRHD